MFVFWGVEILFDKDKLICFNAIEFKKETASFLVRRSLLIY